MEPSATRPPSSAASGTCETRLTDSTGPSDPTARSGQEQQLVRVSQVLQQGDRADVEISPNERVVEPIRRVLGQLDVEQRARTHQSPVDRQAIQELDVSDARPRGCHRSATARSREAGQARVRVAARAPGPGVGPGSGVGGGIGDGDGGVGSGIGGAGGPGSGPGTGEGTGGGDGTGGVGGVVIVVTLRGSHCRPARNTRARPPRSRQRTL